MRVGTTTIEVLVGDITKASCEAIVNAANSQLWMGSGTAGAIKQAAGAQIEHEAVKQGPIQPGEAVVSSAGRLPPPIEWVVHAATMGPDLQTNEEFVRRATRSALKAAAEIGAKSIALPAMGTGVGGLLMDRAAIVMVDEAVKTARGATPVERIDFVVRSDEALRLFEDELAKF